MKQWISPLKMTLFLLLGVSLLILLTLHLDLQRSIAAYESCTFVEAEFLSYQEIKSSVHPSGVSKIIIDCSNGERYYIDKSSINDDLRHEISLLPKNRSIVLLVLPDGETAIDLAPLIAGIATFHCALDNIQQQKTAASGCLLFTIFILLCCFSPPAPKKRITLN